MVKFEGPISDKCALYRQKHLDRTTIIAMSVLFVIALSAGLLFYVFSPDLGNGLIYLFALLVVFALVIVYSILCAVRRKKPPVTICIKVSIDAESIRYSANGNRAEAIHTSSIKKVIKIEESYFILRKHGGIGFALTVEAPLLKEGTIEEFEELFAGKIETQEWK